MFINRSYQNSRCIPLIHVFLQSLTCFDMKLDIIEKGAFRGLNSLRLLNMGGNNLKDPPALDYISNIHYLYLLKNRITSIPKDYFHACHYIGVFDIKFNRLLCLPEMSYISHSVRQLKLSQNK